MLTHKLKKYFIWYVQEAATQATVQFFLLIFDRSNIELLHVWKPKRVLKKNPQNIPAKTKAQLCKNEGTTEVILYPHAEKEKSSWCKQLLPPISMLQDPLRCSQIQKEHKRLYSARPYFHIIVLCGVLRTECSVIYTAPASATLHGQISSTALLRSKSGVQPTVTKSSLDSQGSWRTKKSRGVKKYFERVQHFNA